MWIKSYIEYKTKELIECKLLFKHGKIQEIEMEFFSGIKPFENNSELADNIEILKTYKQDESNKFCKYFIKKSVNKEVLKMFLDINYIQYLKLQWQLKHFLIQSKDIKIEYEDTHGGFHGDGETVAVVEFNNSIGEDIQSEMLNNEDWNKLPLRGSSVFSEKSHQIYVFINKIGTHRKLFNESLLLMAVSHLQY